MNQLCIICRKPKSLFNDEHVIPDSINGYYHIKKVCVDCNSNMGSQIDNKLTNHKFIEFQRHLLGIKGKSGYIPNPLSGTHVLRDNPDQKVQLRIDEDGSFMPYLLPNIPNDVTDKFSIILDKKDKNQKDEIIEKFLKRNGISKDKVQIEESQDSSDWPWIKARMKIDVQDFKLAILKIAYEFTIDQVPNYFDDPKALTYSKILENAEFESVKNKVNFMGDGISKELLSPFSHLIDFDNNNHYLILFDSPEAGLLCFINLFNVFSLGIKMSEKSSFLSQSLLVGKNDIENKSFKVFDISSILSQTYTPIEYRFQYLLPDSLNAYNEFRLNDLSPNFEFYRENEKIPFFNKQGQVAYSDIDEKLTKQGIKVTPKGDVKNEIITNYELDEELYIKLLPINKLYRVLSVRTEQYRKGKI